MTHTIEYYVGSRWPTGWMRGTERFPTMEAAELSAVESVRRERRAEITPITRRAAKV